MLDPVRGADRSPHTPQLALRVSVIAIIAFVLFGTIFFRLWYLQVLSGSQYLAQAQSNKLRRQPLRAPRGSIVDRSGRTLVENRAAVVVRLKADALPRVEKDAVADYGQAVIARARRPAGRRGDPSPIPAIPPQLAARFTRLARVLDMTPAAIQERVVRSLYLAGYAPITLRTDVPADVRGYIIERQEQFPGVSVDLAFLRSYPQRQSAAQLLGTASEVSPEQLKDKQYRGVRAGSIVGQGGVEAQYDRYLRGRDGEERLLVDAQGNPRGQARRRDPEPGNTLVLSLDLRLQRVAQTAFADLAGENAGAFVAMNPRSGEVLAMGSLPSFDPSVLSRPISQKRYEQIFNTGSTPQFNRTTGAAYATGSTFKPVTALAALSARPPLISTSTQIAFPSCVKIANRDFCNSGEHDLGSPALVGALKVSTDVFFYRLGQWANRRKGRLIQTWARKLGLERPTGIDLPGESRGLVPDAAWRRNRVKLEKAYEAKGNPCCLYGDGRGWSVGDNVNLAIGQGDLQATPLQMAVLYGAIAEHGRIVKPRLGMAIQDRQGRQLSTVPRPPARKVKINESYRDAIMEGLRQAASAPGGTSASVFAGWDHTRFPVYGKTGTAQVQGKRDQSWYVLYSYDRTPSRRPIVIAVTAESAGFGAAVAAPIACAS